MLGTSVARKYVQATHALGDAAGQASQRDLRRYARKRRLIRRLMLQHDLQISSFGGAGTTLLCSWLGRQRVGTPKLTGTDWAPWKHMHVPPAAPPRRPGFRAIYVMSDPRDAVASVFRRGFQHDHVQRLDGDVDRWDFTWDLAEFLASGHDAFHLEDHVRSWTEADRAYPILFLRYEHLWDNLAMLGEFVGLDAEQMSSFPERRDRATDWTTEPPAVREGLDRLYGPLARRIGALPPAFVRLDGATISAAT